MPTFRRVKGKIASNPPIEKIGKKIIFFDWCRVNIQNNRLTITNCAARAIVELQGC
jgi:hypothetical protein